MSKKFELSDDDLQAWYELSKTVDVLMGEAVSEPLLIKKETNHKTPEVTDFKQILDNTNYFAEVEKKSTQLGYLKHGTIDGVDNSTANKISKGKFEIESQLDLHGLTQDSALSCLRSFIKSCYDQQKRKVIIITGKGPENNGVLKNNVPRWLNNIGIREYVVMFSYAKPRDGGNGALYVLIRKKRGN